MDLTFQVPTQYCSLQLRTLLPPPETSITGCCFCFGSASSHIVELFLCFPPVAHWAYTILGSSSFSVVIFLPFHSVDASKVTLKILQARLQQYMNQELPDIQAGFRKGRGIRDSSCRLREIKMSDICSLFPPFGDPWPSCLLPSH